MYKSLILFALFPHPACTLRHHILFSPKVLLPSHHLCLLFVLQFSTMTELTRAEKKAKEVRQRMKIASPLPETVAAVKAAVKTRKDRSVLELEQKILTLEEAKCKIIAGYEQRLKLKDATIELLQTKVGSIEEGESKNKEMEAAIKEQEAKITSLEAVEEENKQLKLDLDHLQKTSEYDQKMAQEAISAAEANLSSKVEQHNLLQTKLVNLLSKLQVRSKMTQALSELDNDIAELSDQDGHIVVQESCTQIYQACDAIDVEKIKESLSPRNMIIDERDDFPVQEAEVEKETSMTMKKLASMMACGASLPLAAE